MESMADKVGCPRLSLPYLNGHPEWQNVLKEDRREGEGRMCYKVVCRECGKFSWGGCGKHLAGVFSSIEKGKHCTCRPWPGLVIPPPESHVSAATAAGGK